MDVEAPPVEHRQGEPPPRRRLTTVTALLHDAVLAAFVFGSVVRHRLRLDPLPDEKSACAYAMVAATPVAYGLFFVSTSAAVLCAWLTHLVLTETQGEGDDKKGGNPRLSPWKRASLRIVSIVAAVGLAAFPALPRCNFEPHQEAVYAAFGGTLVHHLLLCGWAGAPRTMVLPHLAGVVVTCHEFLRQNSTDYWFFAGEVLSTWSYVKFLVGCVWVRYEAQLPPRQWAQATLSASLVLFWINHSGIEWCKRVGVRLIPLAELST